MALSAAFKMALEKRFGEQVRFDVPMASRTSLRVGGPADALAMPQTIEDLVDLMHLVAAEGIDWFVIGGGTNLLVRDKGIRGVVISLAEGFSEICRRGGRLYAQSGARLSAVCRCAIEAGFSDLNFAVGIPGTIGGAAMMNAGTAAGDMAGVLSEIGVLFPPDRIETAGRDALDYRYRGLNWPDRMGGKGRCPILLSVSVKLRCADGEKGRAEAEKSLARRRMSQPAGYSAGCFFKNPGPDQAAGELIDRAGLKGCAVGDAVVSERHANFIINRGGASADDLLRLMHQVRTQVQNTFEVDLEPEVRIIGEE